MDRFARLYTARAADECMAAGGVALLAGGSGNPFFTPDTAAALRAAELKADAVFKGPPVDGVYDADPRTNPGAKLIRDITYRQAIDMGLRVMDTAAFQLCKDNRVPVIRVFSMDDLENVLRVAEGDPMGTIVHG
jgi:uridylate kinase